MFEQLRLAVVASGNSWDAFVEAYRFELFQILVDGVTPSVALANIDTTEFSGIVISTVTAAADLDVISQNENVKHLVISNRFYMRTDNRWIRQSTTHGAYSENANSPGGTGVEPNPSWNAMGYHLQAGQKVRGMNSLIRRNNGEVTDVHFRLMFHTGTPTGIAWNSNGETTATTIHSQDNIGVTTGGWYKFNPTITEFTAPTDGNLILFFKPVGTLTATRYLYVTGQIEVAFNV